MAQTGAPPLVSSAESRVGPLIGDALLVISAALMGLTLFLVFFWVPTDLNLGISQRIFYFHVPLGMLGMVSIVVVAIGSALHLITKKEKWDSLAYSAAELGVVFATLIIVTGSIWAKPVWGVWWTWDAKLTTTLILWFIYVSYLMLRAYGPKGSQGARYGSVVALIGSIDTLPIYFATTLWRTAHPDLVVGPVAESGSLDPDMRLAFLVAILAFTTLYAYLLTERYSLKRAEAGLDELYQRAT